MPRIAVAAIVIATGAVGAVGAPGLLARRANIANRHELTRMDRAVRATTNDRLSLENANRFLAEIDAFTSNRRSATLAIAALTRVVPAEDFLSDIRLDTAGGSFVLIGPRAAAIVDALEGAPEFERSALVGSVTPQLTPSGPRERATVRFRWKARSK